MRDGALLNVVHHDLDLLTWNQVLFLIIIIIIHFTFMNLHFLNIFWHQLHEKCETAWYYKAILPATLLIIRELTLQKLVGPAMC